MSLRAAKNHFCHERGRKRERVWEDRRLSLRSSCTHTCTREQEGSGERDSGENFPPYSRTNTRAIRERRGKWRRRRWRRRFSSFLPPLTHAHTCLKETRQEEEEGEKLSPPHTGMHARARRQERGLGERISLRKKNLYRRRERERNRERGTWKRILSPLFLILFSLKNSFFNDFNF